ncbi:response regulator [Oceanidesulfovibrio marinus]|nr:response regulator [Oceanidesulfovibrio marinus]
MAQILVVDDEESIQETFSFFLRKASYDVTTVGSVKDASLALARKRFDIVITDILMPGDMGDTLIEHITAINEPPVIIMVTGKPDLEAMTEMMRRGAYDYLAKPVRKQTLLSTVSRALEHRRLALSAERLARENERYRKHLERLVEKRTQALDMTNRRLMREIEERMAAETLIERQRDLALALSRASTQDETLDAILDSVQALDGVDSSCIHVCVENREGNPLELFTSRNLSPEFSNFFHAITPALPMYHKLMTNQPIHSDEATDEMKAVLRSPNPELVAAYKNISIIPVRYNGKTIAALNAGSFDVIPDVSKRALEAVAECLGGVLNRVLICNVFDEYGVPAAGSTEDPDFSPLHSWGVWEWDPVSDTFFWSYALCRLLLVTNRTRLTPLADFLDHVQADQAALLRDMLHSMSQPGASPLDECSLTLRDNNGHAFPATFICRGPDAERPFCMGLIIPPDRGVRSSGLRITLLQDNA